MTTPNPIRAALERLVEALDDYDPKFDAFPEDALAAARTALEAAPMPPRRFASLTRTRRLDGTHLLDAIDQDGRAWWLIQGNNKAPKTWTETQPLPSREEQP